MPDYKTTDGTTYVAASGRVRIAGNEVEVTKFQPPSIDRAAEQGYACGDPLPRVIVKGPVAYGTFKFTARLPVAQRWLADTNLWLNAVLAGTVTYTESGRSAAVDLTGMVITKAEISESEGATAGEVVMAVEAQPLRVSLDKRLGV